MEIWRKVWRDGFTPQFSIRALQALRRGLTLDDRSLIQGATTTPPPLQYAQEWPVEAACAVGYCGWKGENLATVAEVEEYFARACFEADKRLGEPAACRWFLNWFDETPREAVRRMLLEELNTTLSERQAA